MKPARIETRDLVFNKIVDLSWVDIIYRYRSFSWNAIIEPTNNLVFREVSNPVWSCVLDQLLIRK